MKNYLDELENTGSVRLYENEGFNLKQLMKSFSIMFDPEFYSFGLCEGNKGLYIEIIKLDTEN